MKIFVSISWNKIGKEKNEPPKENTSFTKNPQKEMVNIKRKKGALEDEKTLENNFEKK